MKLPRIFPRWPVADSPLDTRKWVALLASLGGAVVFTLGTAAMVMLLWKGGWTAGTEAKRLDYVGYIALMVCGGALAANLGFSFVMGRRSYKISKDGIEITGDGGNAE